MYFGVKVESLKYKKKIVYSVIYQEFVIVIYQQHYPDFGVLLHLKFFVCMYMKVDI